ncbi:unnamed protein product [Protopolystoma xenopodis]|uniref:PDZ domain-containing protein n=1 Tax=Protopolystoma xenopodis TaxID=117903 RepID=A0A3S5BQE9_9PLAT|nr:unnamed protein product [Protopolystoma xenopodis]
MAKLGRSLPVDAELYDRIIAANSLNLVGATHNEAVEVLKQAGPRLKLYDRIIAANSLNLVGATHNEAVEVLKQAGPRLKLVSSSLLVYISFDWLDAIAPRVNALAPL